MVLDYMVLKGFDLIIMYMYLSLRHAVLDL